ncbi:MAG: hypothetical protein LBN01_03970 [Endomicrobium sp.]|nr:hypothetical protein [Endomicrobium sp.]
MEKNSHFVFNKNEETANKFIAEVNVAAVFVNTSIRLYDGGIFGLGCEIGIQHKNFTRGGMEIKKLINTKYTVKSSGAIRK